MYVLQSTLYNKGRMLAHRNMNIPFVFDSLVVWLAFRKCAVMLILICQC